MTNNILKQFGGLASKGGYKFGIITAVGANNVYSVRLDSGLALTIQDFSISLEVDDPVLLAISEDATNNTFIIKKGSRTQPLAKNFVVGNNLS